MQKFVALSGAVAVGLLLTGSQGFAAPFSVTTTTGSNSTSAKTLNNGETGTVSNTGALSVTSGSDTTAIAIAGTSTTQANQITITNSGTITTGTSGTGGRAIRDNSGGSNTLITNNAGALIQSAGDDVIAVNVLKASGVTDSVMDIENYGTIQSLDKGGSGTTTGSAKGNQAINLTATTGSNIVNNYSTSNSTGVIWATAADAVRPGVNGVVHNDGLIFSNQMFDTTAKPPAWTSSDGVDAQSDTGITIVNGYTTTSPTSHVATFQGAITDYAGPSPTDVAGKTQSTIEGGRHGITGGNTGTNTASPVYQDTANPSAPGLYAMTITNNGGATIQGDDGSGINIDGFGYVDPTSHKSVTNELVTVTNYGTITGNGVHGDGDGVDVDGAVNIDNFGSIVSKNAVPDAGSTLEFSEGVTVGGGTIVNEQGATIEGKVAIGNTQAVGRGITLAGVDKGADDSALPIQSVYQYAGLANPNPNITNSGLIKGDSESGIAVLGTTNNGTTTTSTVTIVNNATGVIEGSNTGVSEDALISPGVFSGQSLNQAAIELDDAGNSYVINNAGTIQQDTTGTGKAVAMHGISNTLNVTGGVASIIGDVSGNTAANSTLNITPGTGNTFSYGYKISNFSVNINSDGSNGTVTLSGANDYTGPTTISGGILYVNNASGSGTGKGKVVVNTGGAIGGYGTIKPDSGNGVTLSAHSSLISGVVHSGTSSGAGLTLDNTTAQSVILDASVGSANLTFFLGAGTTSGASPFNFDTPNTNSSYLNVVGDTAGELKFAAGDSVTLDDLTNGGLQLNLGVPYLLIHATSNLDYAGLVTSGDINGLTNQNGYVTTPLFIEDSTGKYSGLALYLDNGNLEVVPEPGTWAMMIGGLSFLILMQVRRLRRSQS